MLERTLKKINILEQEYLDLMEEQELLHSNHLLTSL